MDAEVLVKITFSLALLRDLTASAVSSLLVDTIESQLENLRERRKFSTIVLVFNVWNNLNILNDWNDREAGIFAPQR
jgi:hypothetical protein